MLHAVALTLKPRSGSRVAARTPLEQPFDVKEVVRACRDPFGTEQMIEGRDPSDAVAGAHAFRPGPQIIEGDVIAHQDIDLSM